MKPLLPIANVALVLAIVVASALYVRSLDPRPAGLTMANEMKAAVEALQAELGSSRDAEVLGAGYTALAKRLAQVELSYGRDADLLAYAKRVAERPALTLARMTASDPGAIHDSLMADLTRGLAHVGSPDDRFVEVMLPLETALAELGRTNDPQRPATAFRSLDTATLLAASGAAALDKWRNATAHAH